MRMKGSEMILQNFMPLENQHGLTKIPTKKQEGMPIRAKKIREKMKIGMLTPLHKDINVQTFK